MKKKRLLRRFYLNEDVIGLSQALIGKFLVTQFGGEVTSGMIIETEAYKGVEDKASHAYNHRRTTRTETLYQKGGVAYVYLCYGIHHLFNVVTAGKDNPHAVLIRAIAPVDGISIMKARRGVKDDKKLASGPGTLTQALGITTEHDRCLLTKAPIWIEDRGIEIYPTEIIASPRVGIDYAQEHKELPWRFRLVTTRKMTN